jgi:solute:Na+ symporter, SSS family
MVLSPIDTIVIILYFIGMIGIGYFSSKKIHDSDDFVVAGRTLSIKVMVGTTLATAMGAFAALGMSGFIYKKGISAEYLIVAWCIGWIALILVARILRESNAVSLPDFFLKRFGPSTKAIASIVTLVFLVNATASQLAAMGQIADGIGIMGYTWGVIIGGTIILVYTVLGGLYAVAYTDFVQMIILTIGLGIFLPWKAMDLVGGFSGLLQNSNPLMFKPWGVIDTAVLLGWIVSFTFAAGAHPAYIQRILASKDGYTAKVGSIWANILTFILSLPILLAALCAPIIFPSLGQPETFIPRMISTHFPIILSGLVLAALLGLVMSTADSFMLLTGTTTINDIYKSIKPKVSLQKLLIYSRYATIIWGVTGIFLALYGKSVLKLFKMGAAAYGAGMFFPLMAAVFWKRSTTTGINCGMLVGCFLTIIWNFTLKKTTGIDGVIIASFSALVVLVVVSLLTEKNDKN